MAVSRQSKSVTTNNSVPGAPDRISFAKLREPLEVPGLLDVQTESFEWLIGAEDWFRRAAERGDPAGQYNLAQMLADGVGAAADYGEALKWFKAAAEQGHARSAMGMAHLYAQGLGVMADPVEAYFWYGVAARSGVEGAQRFRTALGAQLPTAQRQTADSRLARWHAQSAERETR